MFRNKTLLILGAGASKEVELPLGDELKLKISDATRVTTDSPNRGSNAGVADTELGWAVNLESTNGPEKWGRADLLRACMQISDAMPMARSIDNFLHSHRASKIIERCGKLAIARCILAAEANSKMKLLNEAPDPPRMDFKRLAGTWYNRFISLLFDSDYDEFQARLKNLTVIIFNYDRCFEHFMYHAIMTYYGVSNVSAAKIVNSMTIIHPYGTVGNLPWMEKGGTIIDFGVQPNGEQLQRSAYNIKTYTEGVDKGSSEITAIHNELLMAHAVIFLGFGFIDLNMDLLKPEWKSPELSKQRKIYFGTAFGMSDDDRLIVEHNLRNLIPIEGGYSQMKINSKLKCNELFTEYAFTLSAA